MLYVLPQVEKCIALVDNKKIVQCMRYSRITLVDANNKIHAVYALLQLHIALVDVKKIHAVYELVWLSIALVDVKKYMQCLS